MSMKKGVIAATLLGLLIGTLMLLVKSGTFEDKSVTYDEIGDAIKDIDNN